jgi:hypothetical protein
MKRHRAAAVMVGLALVVGLSAGLASNWHQANIPTPDLPPDLALDQMPAALTAELRKSGYALVGYYHWDADGDGAMEVAAVLTVQTTPTESFSGGAYVVLMKQQAEFWYRSDQQPLDGVNARSQFRDLTGDGVPELIVSTQQAERQLGDFVIPHRYTDHLNVFTMGPDFNLVTLGTFSSSLAGVTTPHSQVVLRSGKTVIETAQDIPGRGSALWQPYRIQTYAWDGREFAQVQTEERRRVSPVVSWVVRQNGPWVLGLALLGSIMGIAIATTVHHPAQRRRLLWASALLLIGGGLGAGMTKELLCLPALITSGWVGLWSGKQIGAKMGQGDGASE